MTELMTLFNQLREIAAEADAKRLSVLWEQVQIEYPEFAARIEQCAAQKDAQAALNRLIEFYPQLNVVRFIPNGMQAFEFIYNHFHERGQRNDKQETRAIERTGHAHLRNARRRNRSN